MGGGELQVFLPRPVPPLSVSRPQGRQPVRNIHQIAARTDHGEDAMAKRLSAMETSACSKNDQRKPKIR